MLDKKIYSGIFVIVGIAIVLLIPVFVFIQKDATPKQPISQLVLTPSPVVSPTPVSEPIVTAWRSYGNNQYNFTLEVPESWYEQDYAKAYPDGGTVVAFSPDPLPCATCTYVREGYLSVKVYNQKTHPERYADFLERVKKVGQDPKYVGVALNKKPGVFFANTIAVENQGWVYELTLDADLGDKNALESYIFQRAATSFTFTYLLFNN
jgi:hypothetical protein